jgi:type III secretory pathway component EscS
MSDPVLLDLSQRALLLCLAGVLPPLTVAALCGFLVDLVQSRLGVSEPALPSLARLVGGLGTLLMMAPWLAGQLTRFAAMVWTGLPMLVR